MADDVSSQTAAPRIDPLAFISILRPQNLFIGSLTVISGVAVAFLHNPLGAFSSYIALIALGYLIYSLVAGAGNTVNDIMDIEIDRINRPHRALPSGRMTIRQAWIYVAFLTVLAMVASIFIGLLSFMLVTFFIVVGYAYAAKGKILGIAGNFMVAFSFAFGVLFGSFIYGEAVGAIVIPLPSWLFFLTAFMILQARETIKGAEDVEGDELRDVRTIARVYGYKVAAAVAAVLNFIGIVCYNLVWFWGFASLNLWPLQLLGSAVVFGAAMTPLTGPDDKKKLLIGSTLDKLGALVGLIAFVVIPLYGIYLVS
ncbi:MAG: geranylgeranylglycerol-phosphate geranylgeranyltransferase [Candidatus Thorarchaeota archaeon]|nr:MAG: geranylgeranylglycerol-phosphate geranylgeranyltransferase [Candidatus Thorarchaeota archaeon]